MTKVMVEDKIAAPLDQVWALVSDFTGFVAAFGVPFTSEGEGIGMTRTVELLGTKLTERLEEIDEPSHTMSYSVIETSLPYRDYQAWMAVAPAEAGASRIRWWSNFDPIGSEQEAADLCRGVYIRAIAAMKQVLGATARQ